MRKKRTKLILHSTAAVNVNSCFVPVRRRNPFCSKDKKPPVSGRLIRQDKNRFDLLPFPSLGPATDSYCPGTNQLLQAERPEKIEDCIDFNRIAGCLDGV